MQHLVRVVRGSIDTVDLRIEAPDADAAKALARQHAEQAYGWEPQDVRYEVEIHEIGRAAD